MSNNKNAGQFFGRNYGKDKKTWIDDYVKIVCKKSGFTPAELANLTEGTLFYLALRCAPATKKAVCVAFGLTLETMCRRKRELEDLDRLWVIGFGRCPITGENGVQILSTNEMLRPRNNQLELFGGAA